MAEFFWDSVRGPKWEPGSASSVDLGVSCLLFYHEELHLYSFIQPAIHPGSECESLRIKKTNGSVLPAPAPAPRRSWSAGETVK